MSTIPNCISYDPAFRFELAVIMQDGLRRMYHDQEDIFYYITVGNENYQMLEMPEGAEEGILKEFINLVKVSLKNIKFIFWVVDPLFGLP